MEVDAGASSWASSSANLLRLRVSGAAAGTKSEVEVMVRHTPDPRQVYFLQKLFSYLCLIVLQERPVRVLVESPR